MGYAEGRMGIEAQIEDASGLAGVERIAAASPRLEALVFGPAGFMASPGMRSLAIGAQPQGYAGGARARVRWLAAHSAGLPRAFAPGVAGNTAPLGWMG
jgi:citrate lyase beta subunit